MRFRNRREAGLLLAEKLEKYKDEDVVVYALPRGGVEVGVEVARHLEAPLDLLIPRKIGHPEQPEYAVCALTEDGYLICNQDELERLDKKWLNAEVEKEKLEAKRRRQLYLKGRPPVPVEGKTAIVVDDGVATGLTVLAAVHEVRQRGPSKLVLAMPVLPRDIAELLRNRVDEMEVLDIPKTYLGAVGAYYDDFDQVEDDEVIRLMEEVSAGMGSGGHDGKGT
jgi:putative phosphoribosyl transferase